MGNIEKIFTKTNIEIFEILSKENLHIREIASRIKCSPAKVHDCIKVFKEKGIVKEVDDKNRKVIVLDYENLMTKNIMQILSMETKHPASEKINLFDTISPLDFRYYGRNKKIFEKLQPYLSESGFVTY